MKKEYYICDGTCNGQHPEDAIYRDKEYINRLQEHIDSVYEFLAHDLRLNEQGRDWLFDYVYNEDDKSISFEEYLDKYNVTYDECVDREWIALSKKSKNER